MGGGGRGSGQAGGKELRFPRFWLGFGVAGRQWRHRRRPGTGPGAGPGGRAQAESGKRAEKAHFQPKRTTPRPGTSARRPGVPRSRRCERASQRAARTRDDDDDDGGVIWKPRSGPCEGTDGAAGPPACALLHFSAPANLFLSPLLLLGSFCAI